MRIYHRRIYYAVLVWLAALAAPAQRAVTYSNPLPTRAEILRGALGPMRTCYDVTSYHLDVKIDPTEHTVAGSNKIEFKTMEDFEKMQVDLFSNMNIEKIVFDDQAPATYERELDAVFVTLPEKVTKGSSHSVTFYYSGKPIIARRPPWDGGFTWLTNADGSPWDNVVCQGTGASLWWPNKDHQSDKPENMTLSVTVPTGLDEISNGRLTNKTDLGNGWTRYDWYISYPINNYCVTVNIGKFAHFSDVYDSKGGKLTLDYWVMPENLEKAKKQFQQVKLMLDTYEKDFGPYPFIRDGFKLVECPHTGEEHQTAVAYGNHFADGYRGSSTAEVGLKFDFIIIHECAHEWWGNSVTFQDIADMWIHESFGAYAESLYVEDHFGRDEALKYINSRKQAVRNERPIIAQYGRNQESPGDMYDKGQLILNTLRSVIDDDDKWFSILRGLQDQFKYQSVNADDIFGYIDQKSGTNLDYFFNQYFRFATIPTLVVTATKTGDRVTASYRWQADVSNFHMPIKIMTSPGKWETVTPTSRAQTVELHGINPEDFKVAEDLYYVDVRLRYSYRLPGSQRN
jgi:aminopeptidase N